MIISGDATATIRLVNTASVMYAQQILLSWAEFMFREPVKPANVSRIDWGVKHRAEARGKIECHRRLRHRNRVTVEFRQLPTHANWLTE